MLSPPSPFFKPSLMAMIREVRTSRMTMETPPMVQRLKNALLRENSVSVKVISSMVSKLRTISLTRRKRTSPSMLQKARRVFFALLTFSVSSTQPERNKKPATALIKI
jgi:hypothetical protein